MYTKDKSGILKHLDFTIWDILCLEVASILAYFVRFGIRTPFANSDDVDIVMMLVLMNIVCVYVLNTFKNVLKRGYYLEFVATGKHVLFLMGFLMIYLFATKKGATYSRIYVFTLLIVYFILTYTVRILWKIYLLKIRKIEMKRALLIITTADKAEEVVHNFTKDNYDNTRVVGLSVVDKDMLGSIITGVPVVTNRDNLLNYACREWVDEIFIHLEKDTDLERKLSEKFVEMGIVVHVGIVLREEVSGRKILVEKIGGYHVLTSMINYITPSQLFQKRAIDIIFGLIGTAVTGVLFIVLAPMIYAQSPGPIFFAQERVGRNGKKFKMYKFRSMYIDAEERKKELMEQNRVKDGMMFKLDFDPRIIGAKKLPDGTIKKGLGNIIRDFSLDEFPQFFNVLKGDMSLVGTRPPTVDEWEKYELHHRTRLAIKPGITGLWQVSGRSKITDFEDVVKLDMEYIMNWSMGVDYKIMLKTIRTVLKRDGSM